MFCTKCGKENPEGAVVCTGCGAQLNGGAAPTVPETPVTPTAPKSPAPKKKTGLIIGIVAAVVAVIAIAVGILFATGVIGGKKDSDTNKKNEPKTEDSAGLDLNVEEEEKPDYIGTWTAEVDFSKILNEMFEDDPDLGGYMTFSNLMLKFNFTFNEDGTYRVEGDDASVIEVDKAIRAEFKKGFEAYIKDAGMTVEQFEANSGMTIDEFIDESFGTEFVDLLTDELECEGNYKFEDGKFYSSDDVTTDIVDTEYETYEIVNSKELKFTGCVGEDADEMSFMYPYTMIKK